MYLDADSGSLQFGSDQDYYGTAILGIPTKSPLYPMVSATIEGATITMIYRGQGQIAPPLVYAPPPPVPQAHVVTVNVSVPAQQPSAPQEHQK